MAQTTVIHARIDPATKEATEKVLDALGMTPTEAIRLLYKQIALRREFPLELRVPNQETGSILTNTENGVDVESFESVSELAASWE